MRIHYRDSFERVWCMAWSHYIRRYTKYLEKNDSVTRLTARAYSRITGGVIQNILTKIVVPLTASVHVLFLGCCEPDVALDMQIHQTLKTEIKSPIKLLNRLSEEKYPNRFYSIMFHILSVWTHAWINHFVKYDQVLQRYCLKREGSYMNISRATVNSFPERGATWHDRRHASLVF